jgi:hypothetical protein
VRAVFKSHSLLVSVIPSECHRVVFANEGIFGTRSFRTPGSMVAVFAIYLSEYGVAVKLECKNDTNKCVELPVSDSEVTTKQIGE